jgi:hypothetical protein
MLHPEIHSKSTESQKHKRKLKKSQKVAGVKNRKKLAFVQSTLLLQVEWDPILYNQTSAFLTTKQLRDQFHHYLLAGLAHQ